MDLIIYVIQTTAIFFLKSTPTPPNNPWIGEKTGFTPPVGWTIAGFLLLILIGMIYSELKKFARRFFKKKTSK